MRVSYLTSRFPKLSETFIVNEAAAVADAGIDVDLYAFVEERTAVVHPNVARFDAVFPRWTRVARDQLTWLRRDPGRYLRTWWRALRGNVASPRFLARSLLIVPIGASFALQMERRGTDHVHAHYATHSALGAYVVHLLTGLSYSVTAHAHDIQVDQTMLAEKIEHAAATIAISEFNRNSILGIVDPSVHERINVIHCGVDTSRFTPAPHDGDVGDGLRIAIVAALEERKGHRALFEATRRLLDTGVPVVVEVVGDGPHRDHIAADIRRLGLAGNVELHGGLTADAVADLLHRANVFVLPSLTLASGKMEGIPVALMEAMASGLPVVATDMSGIPELVIDGTTGLLVAEGDIDAIIDALRRLSRDVELRRRLGRNGREHVQNEFDQLRNAQRLRDLFVSVNATTTTATLVPSDRNSEVVP